MIFQSTRPVRGATSAPSRLPHQDHISIHAPRAGRDLHYDALLANVAKFQSTRPVRGATCKKGPGRWTSWSFQSTRPVRGATGGMTNALQGKQDFNPRAPCGARPGAATRATSRHTDFNPRAPCGARLIIAGDMDAAKIFQSTRPVRGATQIADTSFQYPAISIHAPRAGRDSKSIQNYFTHFCDKRQFLDNFTQNAAF